MICAEHDIESESFQGATCSTRNQLKYVFIDDSGKQHQHDPNMIETAWCCSMGHDWHEQSYELCPVCGDDWRTGDGH